MIQTISRLILFCSFIFICCSPAQKKSNPSIETVSETAVEANVNMASSQVSNYDFDRPSQSFVLERKLVEISGLAYDVESNTFITNNDERGFIYSLDPTTFKIVSENKFGKSGDYESIEKVGDDVVVCKNSGKLYFHNMVTSETVTYKTELTARNDIEGLCYDKGSNSLLLACKGQSLNAADSKKSQKSVYQFDLAQKKLIPEPFITILDKDLKSYVSSNFSELSKSKLKKLKNRAKEFSPSGIAVHPLSGDYYLISARGSSLLILNNKKEIKNIVFLNNKTNPQPEGICFDNKNNLYISTEGQGFSGKIFKFNYNG